MSALLKLLERDAALAEIAPAVGWKNGHGSSLGGLHDACEEALETLGPEIHELRVVDGFVIAAAHLEPGAVGGGVDTGELLQDQSGDSPACPLDHAAIELDAVRRAALEDKESFDTGVAKVDRLGRP